MNAAETVARAKELAQESYAIEMVPALVQAGIDQATIDALFLTYSAGFATGWAEAVLDRRRVGK